MKPFLYVNSHKIGAGHECYPVWKKLILQFCIVSFYMIPAVHTAHDCTFLLQLFSQKSYYRKDAILYGVVCNKYLVFRKLPAQRFYFLCSGFHHIVCAVEMDFPWTWGAEPDIDDRLIIYPWVRELPYCC